MTTDTTASHWHLIALTPELGEISFPINVSMSVGRQDSNDVVLATPQISRQHAKFNQVGKNLFIQDLGSSNGTFVNGERISTQAVEVQPNDEIAFADLVFVVAQQDKLQKNLDDNHLQDEITPPIAVASRQDPATQEPNTIPITETIYKITDNPEELSPQSENTPATLPSEKSPATSLPNTNVTIEADNTSINPTPITANTPNPIASSASSRVATSEPTEKKSPILWIIAIIILLIIAAIIFKGM